MAMRRRIKVAVNLTSSRKPKLEPPDNTTGSPVVVKAEPVETPSETQPIKKEKTSDSIFRPCVTPKAEPQTETTSDKDAFKFPPKVEFNRSNSYSASQSTDDMQHTEVDDGVQVMQMDLQKSANAFQMSPLKSQRQRIKPTPVFGQRRNSFVSTPTSPLVNDDIEPVPLTPRRERHYSGSQSLINASVSVQNSSMARTRTESTSSQKRERHYSGSQTVGTSSSFVPSKSMGRIRTESTCSVYSDSHLSTISKSRKTDDHNSQRLNLRREFEARFSNGVPDKSSLKMADLIYYNPVTNPMEQKPKITEIKAEVQEPEPETEKTEKDNSAVPVPQLKLNAKGELILDDKSLEIETTAEQEARKVLAKSSLIFLDENTGMNGFYKRHKRTRDWAPEETIRFYRCLQNIGTDFSMMCQLFPKRTRRDIKLKFKKEERCNAALINKAILHPNSFDIEELKEQFEVEDKEREEEEKEKAAKEKKEKLSKKDYKKVWVKSSKSARALKHAEDVYNLCEGHLGDEPPKKKVRTPKKKTINELNAENTAEEINKKQQKQRARQPRKTKAKATGSTNNEQEHQNNEEELIKSSFKVEQEEPLDNTSTHPGYELLTLENGMMMNSDPIQQQFSMLVQDTDQQQPNDFEEQNDLHQYSTDDEASRTLVNLDSGGLTQVKEIEATERSDLTKEDATFLSNNVLSAEPYSGTSDACPVEQNDNENETSLANYNTEMIETQVLKPPICIEEPTNTSNENSSKPISTRPHKHSIEIDNELAIQQILEDIASGTLQVVTSYDPDGDPTEMVTEIFMVDPKTGDLCDEPLDLPKELVQSILSVMM